MKKCVMLIWLLTGFAATAPAAQYDMKIPEGSLTLDRARTMALENSPDVRQAAERIQAAQAVMLQARSAWWPTVSAQGDYMQKDVSIQPDWSPATRLDASINEWSAGIQMNWLLFDGFARQANILASKYAVEQSRQILADTRRVLLDAVSTAFFQAQLAVENMVISEQNNQFNRTLEEDAQKRWMAGTKPESEVLNFSVKALQAETDFLNAQRDFRIACTALAELMALPKANLPADMIPVRPTADLPEKLPDYEIELAFALENRPDLKAIQAGIEALRQKLSARKGAYAPKVALTAGMDYLRQNEIDPIDQEENDSYIGIAASWDLFTGGRRGAQVQEVSAEIRALNAKRKRAVLSVQSALRRALDNARTARETLERQVMIHDKTSRIRSHIEIAYRAGAASLTRLNEAQTDLVRAAGAVSASRIQYLLLLETIRAETGKILQETGDQK